MDDRDPLARQLAQNRVVQPRFDRFDATTEAVQIDFGVNILKAHARNTPSEAHGPTRRDHGLGRDTVPQVGRPADDVALHNRDLGTKAGAMGGGLVTRRPPADDHEFYGHGRMLRARATGSVTRVGSPSGRSRQHP